MAQVQNTAPIQTPMFNGNVMENGWRQWFTSTSDNLSGKWGINSRNLEKENINETPSKEYVSYTGREVTFLFQWDDGVTFSNSAIYIEFPRNGSNDKLKLDLTLIGGMLRIWEGDNLIGGAYASDTKITIPDYDLSGRVVIEGTILTKVTERA